MLQGLPSYQTDDIPTCSTGCTGSTQRRLYFVQFDCIIQQCSCCLLDVLTSDKGLELALSDNAVCLRAAVYRHVHCHSAAM